jgi:purine nucleosidase
MKPVIFDTDIGIDDAMALLFAHYSEGISIRAITTKYGNASVEDTTRNALQVKEMFAISAPVYQGASAPLSTRLGKGYPSHVHGKNGLGDVQFDEPQVQAETWTAAQALVEISKESEGRGEKISIIAVGGLTNIAAAIALDPAFPSRVGELIVMGGAFGYNQHSGNVSPVAEANIASDPLAADIVFTSDIPTTIVGLDVTQEVTMDKFFIQSLADCAGLAGQFIKKTNKHYFDFYHSISGKHECPLHESSAVAYHLNPDLFSTTRRPVRVVTEGIALGQTIHSNELRAYVTDAWDNIPDCTICTQVNAPAVLALYQSTLALAG